MFTKCGERMDTEYLHHKMINTKVMYMLVSHSHFAIYVKFKTCLLWRYKANSNFNLITLKF